MLCVPFVVPASAKNQASIVAFLAHFLFLTLTEKAVWHNSDSTMIPWTAWDATVSVLDLRGSKSVPG